MSFYDKHVFFCVNQRGPGEDCCNNHKAQEARDYVKDKVKKLGISTDKNAIRINSAGCLGRCDVRPGAGGLSRSGLVHLHRPERS